MKVLHREGDGQEPCDRHGSHEVNAAVEVHVQGVGADAAHEVPLFPVTLVDVVENPQRQGHDAQQVGHGQVDHVDVKRRALPVGFDQHQQGEAVPYQAEHGNEGVGRGVDVVPEVIDGRAVGGVALRGVCHVDLCHLRSHLQPTNKTGVNDKRAETAGKSESKSSRVMQRLIVSADAARSSESTFYSLYPGKLFFSSERCKRILFLLYFM